MRMVGVEAFIKFRFVIGVLLRNLSRYHDSSSELYE